MQNRFDICLGFTTFIEETISKQLTKFEQIVKYSDLSKKRRVSGVTIHQNVTQAKAATGLNFPGFYAMRQPGSFFDKVRNTISLLNAALDDNLMPCLGFIMNKFEFQSLDEENFLNQLTECPYSNLNAADFMKFWLFEKQVPILKITIDYASDSNKAVFTYTYDSDEKANFEPHFAVVIRDENDEILQNTIFVRQNGTSAELEFDFKNTHQLFFANIHDYGNFRVSHPDEVYAAFFEKFENRSRDGCEFNITLPYTDIFIREMLELAKSNKIDLFWLYKILQNRVELENEKLLQSGYSAPLRSLRTCLKYRFFPGLDLEADFQIYNCMWWEDKRVSWKSCERSLDQVKENGSVFIFREEECLDWISKYGKRFQQVLEENIENDNGTYFGNV